jgi:hypothetical protein
VDDAGRELPYVDEHAVEVSAPGAAVWTALAEVLARDLSAGFASPLAHLLGCRDQPTGDHFSVALGAQVVGFHVTRAEAPRELWLDGEHRFARYALRFHLESRGDGTGLRAETRAVFPGLRGQAYRALVIGTGGHAFMVRRLLVRIRLRAEAR